MTSYDAVKLIRKNFFGGTVIYDTHITISPIASTDNGFICKIVCEMMDISVDVLVIPKGVYLLTKSLNNRFKSDLKGSYETEMKGRLEDGTSRH